MDERELEERCQTRLMDRVAARVQTVCKDGWTDVEGTVTPNVPTETAVRVIQGLYKAGFNPPFIGVTPEGEIEMEWPSGLFITLDYIP